MIDEDVRGLEVAMEDAMVMSIIHRMADRSEQRGRFPRRDGTVGEPSSQGLTLDQPHEEIRLPFVIAHREDRDDVRVIELGRGARLRTKTGHIQRRGR